MKLPVNVNVPISTLSETEIIKISDGSSERLTKLSLPKNSDDATKADAPPPKPLKIATS